MSTVEVNPSTGNFDLVGGALTPWTSNIDAAGFNLTDVGQLGIGTASPRGILDAYSPVTVGDVINGYVSQDNGAYSYPDDGYSYIFHVYAYKTVGAGRVYSATPYVLTFTDSSTFSVSYRLIINFDFVAGADGYRVVVINDDYYGAYGDYYFDTNTIPNYVDGGDIYSFESPMVTTPTSVGPDWYIDSTSGDITHVGAYSLSGGITQSDGTTQNSFSSPLKVVTGTYVTGTDAIFMIQGTGGVSTKFRMLGQNPTLSFLNNNSGLPANTGKYQIYVRGDNGTMNWGLLNDAESAETIFFSFTRSGTTPQYTQIRGKLGVSNASIITPSATIHAIDTTEQLRLGYSTSQYYTTTVGSAAGVTFDAVGTTPEFNFSDRVNFADGTASLPSIGWISDDDGTGTGLYRSGANRVGVTANGTLIGQFLSTGFELNSATGAYSWNNAGGIGGVSNGNYRWSANGGANLTTIIWGNNNGTGPMFNFDASNPYMWLTNSSGTGSTGRLGLGIAPSATFHAISTTEQLRVGYNASNYYSTTVGSTGGVTFDAVGSGAKFTFSDALALTDKVTTYNNITTVSNGIPSELATVDLTAQAAAIGATTLYTPTASGMFRISAVLQVTRAATTSSVLGGGTGLTIAYTEPDGSVAQSIKPLLTDQAGAVVVPATGNSGNTTATQSQGSAVIYAKTGVAITYAVGYTSVGATTMQYSVHLKVEAL